MSIYEIAGALAEMLIRSWVRLTGKRVARKDLPWLDCPMGPPGEIGERYYAHLMAERGLHLEQSEDAGLLPEFDALRGAHFDPDWAHPLIRHFYERTGRYRLEVWSESSGVARFCLWLLVTFVSRRMDQLNFPVSSLELAGGMTSSVLPLVDDNGKRVYTGWLRRMVADGRVIYAGLYATETPPQYGSPCVKVMFPLPYGCATVLLRPEVDADGAFRLISSGNSFGDPGFYRIVQADDDHWHVRYIRSLRETFHLHLDTQDVLRCEHRVTFLGVNMLRLHYKIEPTSPG